MKQSIKILALGSLVLTGLAGCCDMTPRKMSYNNHPNIVQPAAGAEMGMNGSKSYTVFFAPGSSRIHPTQQEALDRIAYEIERDNPSRVTIAGHTDRTGPIDRNVRLSEMRADNVYDALTRRGVTRTAIEKVAYGEDDLAVNTSDGVPHEQNRRVVIQVAR